MRKNGNHSGISSTHNIGTIHAYAFVLVLLRMLDLYPLSAVPAQLSAILADHCCARLPSSTEGPKEISQEHLRFKERNNKLWNDLCCQGRVFYPGRIRGGLAHLPRRGISSYPLPDRGNTWHRCWNTCDHSSETRSGRTHE